jgi:hypothetical protein
MSAMGHIESISNGRGNRHTPICLNSLKSLDIEMVYFQFPNVKYVKVTFPAPETFFTIPADWDALDLTVHHGALYHKGKPTFIVPHDFVSTKQEIDIIDVDHMDWQETHEYLGE